MMQKLSPKNGPVFQGERSCSAAVRIDIFIGMICEACDGYISLFAIHNLLYIIKCIKKDCDSNN